MSFYKREEDIARRLLSVEREADKVLTCAVSDDNIQSAVPEEQWLTEAPMYHAPRRVLANPAFCHDSEVDTWLELASADLKHLRTIHMAEREKVAAWYKLPETPIREVNDAMAAMVAIDRLLGKYYKIMDRLRARKTGLEAVAVLANGKGATPIKVNT